MKRRSKLVRARKRRDISRIIHEPAREMFPFDLVIEILMKLPAKSLMRFKSVSKPWSSLICSQYFTNRFQKVSSSLPRLYMCLSLDEKGVLLSASSSPLSLDNGTTMSSFVIDQDLTISAMKGYYVSHIFRGLMCLVNGPSAQIYNTTTRQLVALPDIEESNMIAEDHKFKKIMYHIGYDPVYDQYKVVCTVSRPTDDESSTYMSEHWVLLLGRDGSSRWRKIVSACPPHVALTQGLTINGRMLYLAWVCLLDTVLVSFDMSSEEISSLQVPEDTFFPLVDLIEYDGKVALLRHSLLKEEESVMKLWVMDDAGKKSRWWSKNLVLYPSEMNIVKMHLVDNINLTVQGTTRNGEIILVPQNTYYTPTGKVFYEPQDTNLFYVFLYNIEKII